MFCPHCGSKRTAVIRCGDKKVKEIYRAVYTEDDQNSSSKQGSPFNINHYMCKECIRSFYVNEVEFDLLKDK